MPPVAIRSQLTSSGAKVTTQRQVRSSDPAVQDEATGEQMIGLLGSLMGNQGGRMIGGMLGGSKGRMLGGLAGAMLGGRQLGRLGGMLKGIGGGGQDDAPAQMQDQDAEVLIQAMCNAAKADGVMDETETNQIMSELGDVSAAEQAFLRNEIAAPAMSASDMAARISPDLRAEAYAVSLIAINVDTVEEASYLRDFAAALGLSDSDRNDIHDDLGAELL